jgi:hypothetical protein
VCVRTVPNRNRQDATGVVQQMLFYRFVGEIALVGHHQVKQEHVRLERGGQFQRLRVVDGFTDYFNVRILFKNSYN